MRRLFSQKLPSLPHDDEKQEARKTQLEQARDRVSYCYSSMSPMAFIKTPIKPPLGWWKDVASFIEVLLRNAVELSENTEITAHARKGVPCMVSHLLEGGVGNALEAWACETLRLLNGATDLGRAKSLADYDNLFRTVDIPQAASHWKTDTFFSNLRVAGPNPLMLFRVSAPPTKFPVQEEHFQAAIGNPDDSLARAGEEGRLFLADYEMMEAANSGQIDQYPKYASAPMALYVVPPHETAGSRALRIVAIQCAQKPTSLTPIFTPDDSYNWLLARCVIQAADAQYGEFVWHAAAFHFGLEPFVVSMHRQLAENHPVHVLLAPHLAVTDFINFAARTLLGPAEGLMPQIFSASTDSARTIVVRGHKAHPFATLEPRKLFALRGVDDHEAFPIYPYRDDCLLLYDAIHAWVQDYIGIYYKSDEDVQQDEELQAFAHELTSPTGGRLDSFGQDRMIKTRDYLVDAVSLVIFNGSVQHHAVNQPWDNAILYPPAMPAANFAPPPSCTSGATEEDLLEMLPPLGVALSQILIAYSVSNLQHTTLGQYEDDTFADERVAAPLADFQDRLKEIEAAIEKRNDGLDFPYTYLRPSTIPQGCQI